MGILQRKVQEILNNQVTIKTAEDVTDLTQNSTEWAKSYMSRAKDLSQEYFKKLYDLENQINGIIKSLPSQYNFSEITNELYKNIEEINELIDVYSEGEKGNLNIKLSSKLVLSDFNADKKLLPLRNSLKQYIELLQEYRAKALDLFSEVAQDSGSEIYRKMKWELAYLSNSTFYTAKKLSDLYNTEDLWVVQPFMMKQPKEKVKKPLITPPPKSPLITPPPVEEPKAPEAPAVELQPETEKEKPKKEKKQKFDSGKKIQIGLATYTIDKVFPAGAMSQEENLLLRKYTSKGDKFYLYQPNSKNPPKEVQMRDKEFRSKE